MARSSRGGLPKGGSLQRLLRAQAALFDRLLAAVGEEYSREERGRPQNAEQRRAERVKRLLAGELLDTSELSYELSGWHLGIVASGPSAGKALAELAGSVDRRLLLARPEEGRVWAWLGSRRAFDPEKVAELAAFEWPGGVSLAIGEPARGISGWRLTHRQAAAALLVALRSADSVVRYVEVALLASMLRDELLVTSLRAICLEPLVRERDGGKSLRETLRAYFNAERNVSPAAAALGVTRHTVTSRLRVVEERVGRPLSVCTTEMEGAESGRHWLPGFISMCLT